MIAPLLLLFLPVAEPLAAAPPCQPQHAAPVRFAALAENIAEHDGRCVSVVGYGVGRSLFAGFLGRYRAARYGGRAISEIFLSQSEPGFLGMVSGYCHYRGGPVLLATSWSPIPGRTYERPVGGRNRSRYGNIVPAPPIWAQRRRPAALHYRHALGRADAAELRALHDLWPEGQDEYSDALLRQILDRASPFAELRTEAEPQFAIFIDFRPELRRKSALGEPPGSWFCFCRVADCTGSWPISTIDTGVHSSRPFVCTGYDVAGSGDAGGVVGRYSVFFDDGAVVEPLHTAFRRQSDSSRR